MSSSSSNSYTSRRGDTRFKDRSRSYSRIDENSKNERRDKFSYRDYSYSKREDYSYDEKRLGKSSRDRRDYDDFKRINVSYDSRNYRQGSNYRDENREINNEISAKITDEKTDCSSGKGAEEATVRSPFKRTNDGGCVDDSPKKRFKIPNFVERGNDGDERNSSVENLSPRKVRSLSMFEPKAKNSYIISTPKSERKSRVKQFLQVNPAAVERNLSNNWADIVEEQEEQTKQLNTYVEKISAKYNLNKAKLMKSVEADAETLRKRQKRIYYGKVTAEYQRYIQEVPKKTRLPYHPKTPNKFRKCSRRKFDGLVKKWRKLLHVWDETPDLLPAYKHTMDNEEEEETNEADITDEFGAISNITDTLSYNIDDFELNDSEPDADRLVIDVN